MVAHGGDQLVAMLVEGEKGHGAGVPVAFAKLMLAHQRRAIRAIKQERADRPPANAVAFLQIGRVARHDEIERPQRDALRGGQAVPDARAGRSARGTTTPGPRGASVMLHRPYPMAVSAFATKFHT